MEFLLTAWSQRKLLDHVVSLVMSLLCSLSALWTLVDIAAQCGPGEKTNVPLNRNNFMIEAYCED